MTRAAAACPACTLPFPECRCGMAPFPQPRLSAEEWDHLLLLLKTRSGLRCEARTADCLAGPRGELHRLTRRDVSLHHRQPRGAGGTTAAGIHSLANLLLVCGTGTTGCHGRIERHREWAYRCGLLVRRSAPGRPTALTDPARVPVVTSGGLRVLLDPLHPVPPTPVPDRPYHLEHRPVLNLPEPPPSPDRKA